MKLQRIVLIAGLVLVTVLCLWSASSPQEQTFGRCIVNVPSQWGTYRGDAQGFGIVFEDSSGTLRFLKQMPCGLEGTPNVVLEVRRK